jgi:hypothetical protein
MGEAAAFKNRYRNDSRGYPPMRGRSLALCAGWRDIDTDPQGQTNGFQKMRNDLQHYALFLFVGGCFALASAAPAVAQNLTKAPIEADQYGGFNFTVPSNNIECIYTPPGGTPSYSPPRNEAELSCDRAQPTYLHLGIGAHGPAAMIKNPGEQPCCSDRPVLNYGSAWKQGPFACTSEKTGLTCKRDDGHGFFISREAAKTF